MIYYSHMNKKVLIVGAGPGGLVAGLLLQHKGYQVEIHEKNSLPGGRNSYIDVGGHKFDIGPTFLMMKYILDEVFAEIGLKTEDHLKTERLSPMYRLFYEDKFINVYEERDKMKAELERVFPGEGERLDAFYKREKKRFKKMMPCLQKDYSSFSRFFHPDFINAIPHFSIPRSLFGVLGDYFKKPEARLAFTFQSKYLGMSPWECPGAFAMIPYVEHGLGIFHVEGGLSKISEKMAEIFQKMGGVIKYNSPVKSVIIENKIAKGLLLENGEKEMADTVIVNADFAYAMSHIVDNKKYRKAKLDSMKYSCSTFMVYLGLKKEYDLEHHNVIFAPEYRKNVDDVFAGRLSRDNYSIYVRNASPKDKTLSPQGKSQLYVLVPVPNRQVGRDIDWKKEGAGIRNYAIKRIKERLGLKDLEENIEAEKIITPDDWVNEYHVYNGATFNLAHNLMQMLWFRPHNLLEGTKNCYLVGGGTHPGSGLPTIYESGRISAHMIMKK